MQELRESVLKLLGQTGMKQTELVRRINGLGMYHVQPAELCRALNGERESPKLNRILVESYNILQRERLKMITAEFRK